MQKGIPTRIDDLLEEKEIPRKSFADYLHISEATLSRYIDGKVKIPNITMEAIREYFNVSLDYIYGFSDFRNPSSEYIGNVTGLSDKAIDFLTKAQKSKDDFSYKTAKFINYALENDTSIDDPLYWSIFATMWEYITAGNNEFYIKTDNKLTKHDTAYFKEENSDKMIGINPITLYSQERLNKIVTKLSEYQENKKSEYERIKINNELMTFDSGEDFRKKWNELTKDSKKKGV